MAEKNRTLITAEPGTQELVMIREFDAPRELVFQAHTDPELYIRWVGPKRLRMTIETFEPKTGGSWRYLMRGEDGTEYAFRGVYHEVTAPERIISTFEFEGGPSGYVTLGTITFEELPGGRTKVTSKSVFHSVAARDSEFRILEHGIDEIDDQLAELLASLQK